MEFSADFRLRMAPVSELDVGISGAVPYVIISQDLVGLESGLIVEREAVTNVGVSGSACDSWRSWEYLDDLRTAPSAVLRERSLSELFELVEKASVDFVVAQVTPRATLRIGNGDILGQVLFSAERLYVDALFEALDEVLDWIRPWVPATVAQGWSVNAAHRLSRQGKLEEVLIPLLDQREAFSHILWDRTSPEVSRKECKAAIDGTLRELGFTYQPMRRMWARLESVGVTTVSYESRRGVNYAMRWCASPTVRYADNYGEARYVEDCPVGVLQAIQKDFRLASDRIREHSQRLFAAVGSIEELEPWREMQTSDDAVRRWLRSRKKRSR